MVDYLTAGGNLNFSVESTEQPFAFARKGIVGLIFEPLAIFFQRLKEKFGANFPNLMDFIENMVGVFDLGSGTLAKMKVFMQNVFDNYGDATFFTNFKSNVTDKLASGLSLPSISQTLTSIFGFNSSTLESLIKPSSGTIGSRIEYMDNLNRVIEKLEQFDLQNYKSYEFDSSDAQIGQLPASSTGELIIDSVNNQIIINCGVNTKTVSISGNLTSPFILDSINFRVNTGVSFNAMILQLQKNLLLGNGSYGYKSYRRYVIAGLFDFKDEDFDYEPVKPDLIKDKVKFSFQNLSLNPISFSVTTSFRNKYIS